MSHSLSISSRLTCLSLLLAGCAGNTTLPLADRRQLDQDVVAHARYLKVSCNVVPFFQENDKWLLTDRAPDELDLIDRPNGTPMSPGSTVAILPAGTRLRIEKIEWPTSFVITDRSLFTPRYNPWVYLRAADSDSEADRLSKGRAYVLVLRPDLHSYDETVAELDRFLTADNPDLKSLPPAVQTAIQRKEVLAGMTPNQVQTAWGYPERIHIDQAQQTQVWTWPLAKQQAWFQKDALVRWQDHGATGG